jgi:hypothetical protein
VTGDESLVAELPNGGTHKGEGKFGGYILMDKIHFTVLFYMEVKLGCSP